MKRYVKTVLIAVTMLTAASVAHAGSITTIDFGTGAGGSGGTITIGADVTGTGILIDTVTIVGAPLNNGVFNVDGPALCPSGGGGTCGVLSFDKNLNTISLLGSIPALGIGAPITLLSGDLSGGLTVVLNNGVVGSIDAIGRDTKAREFLVAIGLDPTTTTFQFFGFSTGVNGTGQGSPYTAISTDITNTVTPEPGSMMLLGTGLLGLAGRFRRRFINI